MRALRLPLLCGLLAALPVLPAQAADPRLDNGSCRRIDTGPGPHSLLALPDGRRVLVSSHERRRFAGAGEVYAYEPASGRMQVLPRRGEPAGLVLRPHHMALRRQGGEDLLHLINHDDDNANGRRHSILIYAVEADGLRFRRQLSDPLLSSPNHLAIAPDGDIYVSNDRRDGSSVLELALRLSRATLVHYREGRGWRLAAEGLSFPNGVQAEAGRVLVSQTFGGNVLAFARAADGSLGPARELWRQPLLDGLKPGPEPGSYLTIAHGSLTDFLRHKGKGSHRSPATVWQVDGAGAARPFFREDGRRISGLSAVVFAGDRVLFGQSFEPWLLQCPWRG